MARSTKPTTPTNFKRMLHAAHKQGMSSRKPWRHHMKRMPIKLTNVEKLARKQVRRREKEALQAHVNDASEWLVSKAKTMAEELGKHNYLYYLDVLMQSYCLKQKRWKLGPFQAFVSMEMKRINAEVPEGTPRMKVLDCMPDIAKKWVTLTDDEKIVVTADELCQLEENRENRELAGHNSSISAFHNVQTSLEDAKLLAQRLNARTGAETIIITVRSNSEHFNPPEAYVTSDRVADFFTMAFKQTPVQIASHLEGYCIAGIEGE
ncbi:hypothetical protein VKT23_019455 [Stygiomarasmius scandens]|uniref:Uncharacterized protein n=1 Tax=Marasmiellus scandens TaxID=2682957 RepID=A0ABR1IMT5_9AGAR